MSDTPAKSTHTSPGLFGIVICLSLLGLSGYYLTHRVMSIVHAYASSTWPSVQGQITHSELKHFIDDSGKNRDHDYTPMIMYAYQVDGKDYTSKRVSYSAYSSFNVEADAQAIVDRYPVGKAVTVYHKPDDPTLSALETGFESHQLFGLAVCLFLFFVCVLITWNFFKPAKPKTVPVPVSDA